jgi:hypothetical protein
MAGIAESEQDIISERKQDYNLQELEIEMAEDQLRIKN